MDDRTTVHDLTRAIASGDPEAFGVLYDAWFDRMYAEARRCTRRDESFCLDVVQDAMVRVMRSIKPIEHEGELAGWLRAVVRSCAYDLLRREARRRRREAAVTMPEGDAATTEHADALDERLTWLRRELASGGAPHAHLLGMRFRLGLTLEQIGAALGIGPGGADGRIRRAVAALRSRAEEQLDDG